MNEYLDIFDLILPPFYLIGIFIFAHIIKNKNILIPGKSYYRYMIPALTCKIIGGISLCMIYIFYYESGGDVTNYFLSARTYVNILYDGNFSLFADMLNFRSNNIFLTGFLSKDYGMVHFRHTDVYALFTVVLSIPICILGCKSFIASTIVISTFSFIGLWKLYEVFVDHFPQLSKQFAIAIFFMPSLFFWGSGFLKDTYSIFSVGIYTYSIYKYVILKQRNLKYLVMLMVSIALLIFIKPYILFALMPGSLIWVNFNRINNITNPIVKALSIPVFIITLLLSVAIVLNTLGNYLGDYNMDNVLNKAVKTQKDLVREQYGSNFHDIGSFDASFTGVASKIPAALNMALFRPYIWDTRNPLMLLSGLENLFTLFLSLYILIKVRFKTLFKSIFGHPLLVFSLLFSLFFAFSVGLTTSNYGALVRLKTPFVPFYISSLFILYEINKKEFQSFKIF